MAYHSMDLRVFIREYNNKRLNELGLKVCQALAKEPFGARTEQLQAKCQLSKKTLMDVLQNIDAQQVNGVWCLKLNKVRKVA